MADLIEKVGENPLFFMADVMNDVIESKITQLIESQVVKDIYELFFVKVSIGKRSMIRVGLDRKMGGINADECRVLNDKIASLVESSGFFQTGYTLEVSSPGVDWPLKDEKDYRRVTGKTIRLTCKENDQGVLRDVRGFVIGVESGALIIKQESECEGVLSIPVSSIVKAQTEIAI